MEASTPRVLLRSLLVSYVLSGILLIITSFALYKFRLKEAQVKMAVNVFSPAPLPDFLWEKV